MRVLGIVLALLCAGAALFVWFARSADEPRSAASERGPAAPGPTGVEDERVAALTRRVQELELSVSALRDELARAAGTRSPLAPESAPPSADAAAPGDERTPRWYLDQYVASFQGGGGGSEYFRLAVEAYAPSLVREIGALVLDPRANASLRQCLVAMLGDGRFRGHGGALDVCLRVLPTRGADALVAAALTALLHIGDGATARVLEGLAWSLDSAAKRGQAIGVLVSLAGAEANAALVRLWPTAPDDGERFALLKHLSPGEGVSSLALFELASYASQPVRLRAAQAIGAFRLPAFPPFIQGWIARESDAAVREALGAAQGQLAQTPRWGAEHASGPPDAESLNDDPNAWASAQADMGMQWLELDYEPPRLASGVRIHEVCVAGALASVVALDERGTRHELWSGVDPTTQPGVFELEFPTTAFRVRTLRLTLDTNRRPGWSEIDAVELVGPEGRAWASGARASSSYGAGQRSDFALEGSMLLRSGVPVTESR